MVPSKPWHLAQKVKEIKKFDMWNSRHLWVCICVHVFMCGCRYVLRANLDTKGWPCSLQTGSLIGLELSKMTRLAVQGAPEIFLPLPLSLGVLSTHHHDRLATWVVRIKLKPLCLPSKRFLAEPSLKPNYFHVPVVPKSYRICTSEWELNTLRIIQWHNMDLLFRREQSNKERNMQSL